MSIGSFLLDILFPRQCLGCKKWGKYLCGQCSSLVHPHELSICPVCTRPSVDGATHPGCRGRYTPDGLTAVFPYNGIIRKAVKELKYRRVSDLVEELSTLLVASISTRPERFLVFNKIKNEPHVLMTAIPLHPFRQRKRWFNQSELVAESVAQKWKIPFKKDVLIRVHFNKPQAGLAKKERLTNIKGSFVMNPNAYQLTSNASLILFDDVWTTGATMREAVNVLKRGGVKRVWCLTVAR